MPFDFHRHQIPLETDAIIWRYFDIQKFQSLLENQALFFCRTDKLDDRFEGSIPRREAANRIDDDRAIAQGFGRPFDFEKAKENSVAMGDLHRKFKRGMVVNCWHINKEESDAMWRLYLRDNKGVAIQSSASRIKRVVESGELKIGMSKVRYLDYEHGIWYHPQEYPHINYNLITPFVHKRLEFIHEAEFRLYHQIDEAINSEEFWGKKGGYWKTENGIYVKVNLCDLIERIVLPPTVDEENEMVIKSLVFSASFNFPIEISKLKREPDF